jgi:ubiquitin-activating enzyme E1
MNDFCRQRKIGFVMTLSYGLTGTCFVDFGDEFIITDKNGEETKQFMIVDIS